MKIKLTTCNKCLSFLVLYSDFEKRKLDLKDLRVIVGVHDLTKHDEYEDIFYIEYIVKHWNYSGKNFFFIVAQWAETSEQEH
jgi:hypothetical protein